MMAYLEAPLPYTPKDNEEAPESERQPLLTPPTHNKTPTTYRKCCCCSLGTAVTVWAVFLLAFSTYILFDPNVSGAAYTAGGVVGLITAALLLSAIGKRNAFPAFVAVYTQLALYIIWVLQLALTSYIYYRLLQSQNSHRATYTLATAGWGRQAASGRILAMRFFVLDLPLNLVLTARIALLGLLLLLSHVNLRLLWSFYRVLQAGGTTFEFKTAETIEEQALQAQLPAPPTATPSPRQWDPLGPGRPRPGEAVTPW